MQEVIKEGDGEGQAWIEEGLIDMRAWINIGQRRGKSMLAAMALAMAAAGAPTAISAASGLPRAPARDREHVAEPATSKDLAALQAAQAKRDRKAAKRRRDAGANGKGAQC